MRILVTGASGFVGSHFLREAATGGHAVFAMDVNTPSASVPHQGFVRADLSEPAALRAAIERFQPDACLHLAAVTFIPAADADPAGIVNVNVMGTANLLDAFRTTAPTTRILVVSSTQVYGHRPRPAPVKEDEPLTPDSLYGITKAAADEIARFFARQYGMPVMVARPGNHAGPGQSPRFVLPAFARQVKAIRGGSQAPIRVGNLESRRDFTDVRDVVRAYRLLLERGRGGLAYNIASGTSMTIGAILQTLCDIAGVAPRIEQDPALYRADGGFAAPDTSRLLAATAWKPAFDIRQTLSDILEES